MWLATALWDTPVHTHAHMRAHLHWHSLTSQGPVVNSEDLAEALEQGEIFGAGLDVITGEPNISPDHPLVKAKNCELSGGWMVARFVFLALPRLLHPSFASASPPSLYSPPPSTFPLWGKPWMSFALYTFPLELPTFQGSVWPRSQKRYPILRASAV
jgi:hypothetical protein